jgi:hypothetical protein
LLLVFAILLFHVATYLLLFFRAESRARAVERVLPSMLQLIAANLNSGMTPFQAVRESSRVEFGVLKDEVDRTVALSLSTMSFPEALMDMRSRIKSPIFRNVIELFVEGMRTGGPLATLLADMSRDIMENLDLRREIVTRTKSYIMFIGFIVIFGAPLLAAVSLHFIRTISDITRQIIMDMPEVEYVGGVSFGQLTLRPEFLAAVNIGNIVATGIIASWLLAAIATGKDKYMVKYALIVVPIAVLMFYVFDYLVGLVL